MFGICCSAIVEKLQQTLKLMLHMCSVGREKQKKTKRKQLYKNYCSFYLGQLLNYMETSWL